jgi:ribosome-associated translation inhibitor RaiA
MRIDVTGSGIEEIEPLKTYVIQRLLFALSRFNGRVVRANAHLSRIQGASGEPQVGCRLTVRLHTGRKIFAEVSNRDAHAAIDQSVERAHRLVGLRLVQSNTAVTKEHIDTSSTVGAEMTKRTDYPHGPRRKRGDGASVVVLRKRSLR